MREMARFLLAGSMMAILGGCAHQTTQSEAKTSTKTRVVVTPPPAPAQGIRLAVLPVENDGFPELAEWVSNLLADARVNDVDEYFKTRVALEVVQLSIECVDPTPACYSAVGKSLRANRLLLAQISGSANRKHDHSVRLKIMLFDVDGKRELASAQHTFKNQDEALADAEDLMDRALGDRKQTARAAKGKAQ
jgi:hypothetical protein